MTIADGDNMDGQYNCFTMQRYRKGDKLKFVCGNVGGEFVDVTVSQMPDGEKRRESGEEQNKPLGIPTNQILQLQDLAMLPMYLAEGSGSNGRTILRMVCRSLYISRGSSAAIAADGEREPYLRLNGKLMSVAIEPLKQFAVGRQFLKDCELQQMKVDIVAGKEPHCGTIY